MKASTVLLFSSVILTGTLLLPAPAWAQEEEQEEILVSGFQRDIQPIWIHELNCHLKKKSGKLLCRAEIENVSGTRITAIGYRWEQGTLDGSGTHSMNIPRARGGISDWKLSLKENKVKGRLENGDEVSIKNEFDPIKDLEAVHFHVLFVELWDGTIPGGMDPRFRWVYDRMIKGRKVREAQQPEAPDGNS